MDTISFFNNDKNLINHFCLLIQGLCPLHCSEGLLWAPFSCTRLEKTSHSSCASASCSPARSNFVCDIEPLCQDKWFHLFLCWFELQTHQCFVNQLFFHSSEFPQWNITEKLVSLLSEVIGFSSWWADWRLALLWSHGEHPQWRDVGGFVQFLSLLFCCSRAYKQLPMWVIITSSKITLVIVCKIWVHWEKMGGWERKRRQILMTSVYSQSKGIPSVIQNHEDMF